MRSGFVRLRFSKKTSYPSPVWLYDQNKFPSVSTDTDQLSALPVGPSGLSTVHSGLMRICADARTAQERKRNIRRCFISDTTVILLQHHLPTRNYIAEFSDAVGIHAAW